MKITRNNYEAYFIDYLDGKLSDFQIQELEALLMSNEDLREELEGLEKIMLKPQSEAFSHKENLKQPDLDNSIDEDNFEFYCIAEMEGDLTQEQQEALNQFLFQNPSKKEAAILFQQTRIQSPENIIYTGKSDLKRSLFTIRKMVVYRGLSIAAGIAILLALFFTFIEKDVENAFVAELENVKQVPDTTAIKSVLPERTGSVKEGEQDKVEKKSVATPKKSISIIVGTSIASTDTHKSRENEYQSDKPNSKPVLSQSRINSRHFSNSKLLASTQQDIIDFKKLNIEYPEKNQPSSEFLSLQDLAKKKYNEKVHKDGDKNSGLWNVASAGVSKIGQITGSELSLNATQNEDGENKKVSFNSRLLSFSAPINRD